MTWPPQRGRDSNEHQPYEPNTNLHRRLSPSSLTSSYPSGIGGRTSMSEVNKHDATINPSSSSSSSVSGTPGRSLPSISHMMFSGPQAGSNGGGYSQGQSTNAAGGIGGEAGGPSGGGQQQQNAPSSSQQGGQGGPPYTGSSSNGGFPNSTLPPLPDSNRMPHHMVPSHHPHHHPQHPQQHPQHGPPGGGHPYFFRPQYGPVPGGYPPGGDPYGPPHPGAYYPQGPSPMDSQTNFAQQAGYEQHHQQGGEMVRQHSSINARNGRGGDQPGGEQLGSPSIGPDDRTRKLSNIDDGIGSGSVPPSSKRARHDLDYSQLGPGGVGVGGSRHPGLTHQQTDDANQMRRGSTEDFTSGGQGGGEESALSHIIQNDGSSGGEKTSGRTLKRTYQACVRCRKKKLKCDSALPRCTPCQSSGSECQQADVRRQTAYPRGYVEDLESRCAMFQEILAKMFPAVAPADYPSLLQNGNLSPNAQSHTPSRMLNEQDSPRSSAGHHVAGMPNLPEE